MTDVLRPADEAAVAEAVAEASAQGRRIRAQGGGSRAALTPPRDIDVTIETTALSGVVDYEPGALTLIVRAGTPMSDVQSALAAEGQQLPFEPMDHRLLLGTHERAPTIGGAAAVGASGPRRLQAGAFRDSVIGARLVNGRGEVVTAGGRVMKNVTGYDVARLAVGAHGALGVVTELSFKVTPRPEASATLLLRDLDDAAAVKAMAAALSSPFDITAAAHLPAAQTLDGAGAVTMIRLEGFADSVSYRAQALADRLASHGPVEVVSDASRVSASWAYVRDAAPFATRTGAVWRASVRPSDGPALAAALAARGDVAAFYDWAGGLVWLLVDEAADGDDPAAAQAVRAAVDALPGRGRATLVRASERTLRRVDMFPPNDQVRAAIETRVRAAFDPNGAFAPADARSIRAA